MRANTVSRFLLILFLKYDFNLFSIENDRSTIDNLHIIKSEIEQAFENKQTLGMVSLDISKAYDSVWRHRVLMLISKILANGNMNNYIKDFLIDRHFQVKVSNSLSSSFSQQNGVPQGSSLAVTLFLLAINDIVETIRTPVSANLFADDFNILIRSQNTNTVQYYLQTTIDSLSKWSNDTGFNFSSEKSQYILFSKKRNQEIPQIKIDNRQIPIRKRI